MKKVETECVGKRKTFSLFVISNMNPTAQKDLDVNDLEEIARELLDLYFVYIDGLVCCFVDVCITRS